MNKRYKILFSGVLQADADLDETAKKMSKSLKIPLDKATALMTGGKPRVLKRDISYETAEKYRDKLTRIGLQVKILETAVAQDVQPSQLTKVSAVKPTGPPQSRYLHDMTRPGKDLEQKTDSINPYAPPKSRLKEKEVELILVSGWIRFFTWVLDHLFYYIVCVIIAVALGLIFGHKSLIIFSSLLSKYLFGASILISYYALFEATTGRTPGKLIVGTKVVNESGKKPSIGQIFGRTLTRLVPFEALTFFGAQSRGLHDRLSKTLVIKNR